jgi:uncharacterized membrane protein
MQYLALTVVTLVGGAGSFVSLDSGNPMFAVIFAVIAVAGFAAGCVWRMSHVARDRRRNGLDS